MYIYVQSTVIYVESAGLQLFSVLSFLISSDLQRSPVNSEILLTQTGDSGPHFIHN